MTQYRPGFGRAAGTKVSTRGFVAGREKYSSSMLVMIRCQFELDRKQEMTRVRKEKREGVLLYPGRETNEECL
jgi:hypothetical protein